MATITTFPELTSAHTGDLVRPAEESEIDVLPGVVAEDPTPPPAQESGGQRPQLEGIIIILLYKPRLYYSS